jgi:hypothetical protein
VKRTFLAPLLLMAAVLALASGAQADNISIALQEDGGAITLVASSSTGYASFVGTYGTFTFNSVSGTGFPNLAEPSLASTSLDVQNSYAPGTHTLNVFVTQSGVTSPTGVNSFLSSFTSQAFTGLIFSVTEQTFIDTTNGLYGGTLLASSTFTGIGSNSSVNNTPSLSNPYSETVEYTIITNGAGRVNDTIDIDPSQPTPVPEPSGSSLLLSAFGVGGLLLTKRRILGV